jgi:hypothetical protein
MMIQQRISRDSGYFSLLLLFHTEAKLLINQPYKCRTPVGMMFAIYFFEVTSMKAAVFCGVLLASMAVQAKDSPSYQSGVLKEMSSVECGFEQKSAKGLVGELVGTDDSHSKMRKTFCHEYVLETNHVVYHIRPREEKHPALLPVGEKALFRMKKDLMVLKVPEGDDKEREYDVVSMLPVQANDGSAPARTTLPASTAAKQQPGNPK